MIIIFCANFPFEVTTSRKNKPCDKFLTAIFLSIIVFRLFSAYTLCPILLNKATDLMLTPFSTVSHRKSFTGFG